MSALRGTSSLLDDQAWPDYAPDEILPGLWQGGTEYDHYVGTPTPDDHYHRQHRFDLIITLFADAQPAPWGVEEIRFGFPDSDLTPAIIERAVRIAAYAHERWQEGDRVLIRCQAGVNRSGLLTTLTLMHHGLTAAEAIARIRSRRGGRVLCNRTFERWLLTHAAGFLPCPAPASAPAPSSSAGGPSASTSAA